MLILFPFSFGVDNEYANILVVNKIPRNITYENKLLFVVGGVRMSMKINIKKLSHPFRVHTTSETDQFDIIV